MHHALMDDGGEPTKYHGVRRRQFVAEIRDSISSIRLSSSTLSSRLKQQQPMKLGNRRLRSTTGGDWDTPRGGWTIGTKRRLNKRGSGLLLENNDDLKLSNRGLTKKSGSLGGTVAPAAPPLDPPLDTSMEVVTGALPSVIAKLGHLLVGEFKLQNAVKGDILVLKSKLEKMKAALEKLSSKPADQLDIHDKIWVRNLKELSDDIEGRIGTFMTDIKHNKSAKLHGFNKFIIRSMNLSMKPKIHHGFATEIKDKERFLEVHNRYHKYGASLLGVDNPTSEADLMEAEAAVRHAVELHPSQPTLQIITDERGVAINVRVKGSISSLSSTSSQSSHVKEAREKRDEYKIDGVAKPVTTTVFQYMKGADLVGIEEAVNDLMKILTQGNEISTSQAKIVSIVGLGGLGKTTLAHAIYGKLRAQFDCWAFVSVSQNPDMMKLFKCMLCQLGKKNSANIHEEILDERLLIYELTEFLHKRRYFIVIDDIQDISVWRMIKCALPATNNDGCIIITTTRVLAVAKQVGAAYRMRHLSLEDSRILLHRRIFGTEDQGKYVDHELIEISEKILERCSGIPLAIIMISGLLASKGVNKIEWDKVYRSMKYGGLDEENMKTIVSLCYEDLPSHLKNCLLYLSVFPEGCDVDKDRLIRLWIGEGLIQCGKQDESPFELGESYFQELINRCMIQPVYKRWYYDMTECCYVHDMVFDLISEVTGKEKLVSVWNNMHHTFRSQEAPRLSLQRNSMLDHATHWATMNMQRVRSVVVFPSAVKLLPDLASFRDLLVLDLQSCCLSQGYSLKHLENFVHLRYLGLRDTGISHLPEVGKLQSLQTLDVRRNEISSLPSTVNELKHLMCLRIDSWTRAPNGIGSFTSLEELSTICIQDSTDIIEELGNLTELRVLGIDCCTEWNVGEVEKALVECLYKLQKIKTLSISMVGEGSFDAWVPPRHLLRLELTGCWPSTVPALLNNPSLLLELSFLSMEVRKLRQEDLESLGRLPALSYLDIEVDNQKRGAVQTFIIGACSFPCLVHCTLRGYIGPVVFQQGAMPEVARLHLALPVQEIRETAGFSSNFDLGFNWGFRLGFWNLPWLQDVSFLLLREGASKGEVEEAEAALRQAIESHPNNPTLEIL